MNCGINEDLDNMQVNVVNMVKLFLRYRSQYYAMYDDEENERYESTQDWRKVISVTGKPGTGKTKTLHACVKFAVDNQFTTLVATPTAMLASSYRALFDEEIDANTIHSSFLIPIDGSSPQINWNLSMYDLMSMAIVLPCPRFLLFSFGVDCTAEDVLR